MDVEQPGEGAQQGRLAGAVGPEQGHDRAVGDLHADAAQGQDDVVVDDLEIVRQQHASSWKCDVRHMLSPSGTSGLCAPRQSRDGVLWPGHKWKSGARRAENGLARGRCRHQRARSLGRGARQRNGVRRNRIDLERGARLSATGRRRAALRGGGALSPGVRGLPRGTRRASRSGAAGLPLDRQPRFATRRARGRAAGLHVGVPDRSAGAVGRRPGRGRGATRHPGGRAPGGQAGDADDRGGQHPGGRLLSRGAAVPRRRQCAGRPRPVGGPARRSAPGGRSTTSRVGGGRPGGGRRPGGRRGLLRWPGARLRPGAFGAQLRLAGPRGGPARRGRGGAAGQGPLDGPGRGRGPQVARVAGGARRLARVSA